MGSEWLSVAMLVDTPPTGSHQAGLKLTNSTRRRDESVGVVYIMLDFILVEGDTRSVLCATPRCSFASYKHPTVYVSL